MLEVGAEIRRDMLDQIGRTLNERLSGLTLQQIRETFVDRMRDVRNESTGLIRLFIDSVELFTDSKEKDKIHIGGATDIIEQPEFIDPRNFRGVIEMIENEEIIVHLLERHDDSPGKNVIVTIGQENDQTASDLSLLTTHYNISGVTGKIGLLGPKRMNYAKMIPLVEYVAHTVARILTK